jgi:putative membrane protein insertion efficiency factor
MAGDAMTPPAARRGFAAALFRFYRLALSPLIGPACRYEPTCSHYAEHAIERWGWGRGLFLAAWRVLRCHPFARGGLDPVPERPSDAPAPGRASPGTAGTGR